MKANSLVVSRRGETGLRLDFPARLTPTTCELLPNLSYDDAAQVLHKVQQVRNASNWWLGAALNAVEARHGEMYAQAASETGLPVETLQILKYVESRVPPANRLEPPLTWSHARVVAKFEPEEQKVWLNTAILQEWSVRDLSQAIKADNGKGPHEPEEPETEKGCDWCGKPLPKLCLQCLRIKK